MGRDKKTDLALLKVKVKQELTFLPLGNSDEMRVGDWVLAVGNPFGLENTVTAGIISAKGRIIGAGPYDDFIQTDASINPGNSGGPLINLKGEVVGVNTAIVAQGQGIGFAIPVNLAREVMNQLRTTGRVTRGWLGVYIQPVTKELAEKFKLEGTDGVLVADVVKDGPADKAGIQRGDVIVEFEGKPLKDWHSLPRLVAETPVGREVRLKVMREGRSRPVTAIVGELKDEQPEAAQAEEPAKVQLGLTLQRLTPELAQQLGIPKARKGLVVTGVQNGGPADEAGLRRGDVILEAAQKPVDSLDQFGRHTNDVRVAGWLDPPARPWVLHREQHGTPVFALFQQNQCRLRIGRIVDQHPIQVFTQHGRHRHFVSRWHFQKVAERPVSARQAALLGGFQHKTRSLVQPAKRPFGLLQHVPLGLQARLFSLALRQFCTGVLLPALQLFQFRLVGLQGFFCVF